MIINTDPDRFISFTNDPSFADGWCLQIGRLYIWRDGGKHTPFKVYWWKP